VPELMFHDMAVVLHPEFVLRYLETGIWISSTLLSVVD